MNTYRVTVVMPVYNGARHLAEAIDSALKQVDCEVELVVVDDGSTDESAAIVRAFGPQVRYVRQDNSGPAAARNLGVSLASHDWIAFLDADDVWEHNKLSCQLEAARISGSPFVYTNARNFGDDRVAELRSPGSDMPNGAVFADLLLDNFITLSSVLIRRELFQSVGGFRTEHHGAEDWDLWLRIAAIETNVKAVPEALTRYRWQADSLSKDHLGMARRRRQTLECAISHRGQISVPWKLLRRARANVLATSAWFAEDAFPRQSFLWYGQSLMQWPFSTTRWKALIKAALKVLTPSKLRRWLTSGPPHDHVAEGSELATSGVPTRLPAS